MTKVLRELGPQSRNFLTFYEGSTGFYKEEKLESQHLGSV